MKQNVLGCSVAVRESGTGNVAKVILFYYDLPQEMSKNLNVSVPYSKLNKLDIFMKQTRSKKFIRKKL